MGNTTHSQSPVGPYSQARNIKGIDGKSLRNALGKYYQWTRIISTGIPSASLVFQPVIPLENARSQLDLTPGGM